VRQFRFTRLQIVVAAVVVLGLLFFGSRLLSRSHAVASPPIPTAASSTHEQAKAAGEAPMYIDVVGAVRRPGLYRLPRGSRIADAVARAGGATRKAQLELVNVAAPLADGEQVVVPRRGSAAASAPSSGTAGVQAAGPVHLSTATAEELDSLPGVGPVTAQKIIDYRQQHGGFSSVDELDAVPGIGPARMEQLKGLIAP
jgi:competence protein ComEA